MVDGSSEGSDEGNSEGSIEGGVEFIARVGALLRDGEDDGGVDGLLESTDGSGESPDAASFDDGGVDGEPEFTDGGEER